MGKQLGHDVVGAAQLGVHELRSADDIMTELLTHLFKAGGKRFRPLFTVLSAQIGPDPDAVANR
ncbi:hypothetical protein JHV675_54030 [Mycobacterium avium subsp. hominissuis]